MGFTINRDKTDSRMAEVSRDFLAHIAMLYYKEGLMQTEIATRINVSRASVVNYLKMARDYGIVDVRIEGEAFSSSNLSRELRDRFNLVDAYVAEAYEMENGRTSVLQAIQPLARVAAMAVYDLIGTDTKVGVAWGATILLLANEIPRGYMPSVGVYQLLGSTPRNVDYGSEACAMRIAARLTASFRALHAPAIVATKDLRDSLVSEPGISDALVGLRNLDMAVFSVNSSSGGTHTIDAGIHSAADVEVYNAAGAVGVLAGRFFDKTGAPVLGPSDDRMIGIQLPDLKKTPSRILVSGGEKKLAAIAAALAGGFATHLVIDRKTGEKLKAI